MRGSSMVVTQPGEGARQDDGDVFAAPRAIVRGIVAGALAWAVVLAASTALFAL